MCKILITGALGQIGSELSMLLCRRYGTENIIATDKRNYQSNGSVGTPSYCILDVTKKEEIERIVRDYHITTIYHLAALLSAVAESSPQVAWNVNINGLYNILEIAREYGCAVFVPSSIGVFGPTTPATQAPQDTIQCPTTMYGVTKVAGELLCNYYHKRFGVDTRGLRYPGLISWKTPPGGGTTDYAVHIYCEAIRHKKYTCFLKAGTFLDMLYMPDAIRAAVDLMEADPANLIHRNAFNITGMSVSPEMIADSIKRYIPDFKLDYNVDPVRQGIADSWPDSIDDSAAREEWGWQPVYNLDKMTGDMIKNIRNQL
jgi:nucleoside-diphosphate-sugar epimerase